MIQPVTVRPNNQGFEIVAGARRFRAAQLAELFSVPARIVEIDDAQALEWQLVELSIVVKRFLFVHWGPHVVSI
jgi:ParB family chromosome partitioning protein